MTRNMASKDPFTRHTLLEVLNRAWYVFWRQPTAFLGLGSLMVGPSLVLWAVVLSRLQVMAQQAQAAGQNNHQGAPSYHGDDAATAAFNAFLEHGQVLFREFIAVYLLICLVQIVVKAATIRTALQAYLHQGRETFFLSVTDLRQNLRHGLGRLPTILCWFGLVLIAAIVYYIAAMVSIAILAILVLMVGGDKAATVANILFIVMAVCWAYYVSLVLVFCLPAIVLERVNALESLRRAWSMAQGHRCMVFCTLLIVLVATILVMGAENLLLYILGFTSQQAFMVHSLTNFFFVPFTCVVVTVLYVNVRIDKEGLNHAVLRRELDESIHGGPALSVDARDVVGGGTYKPVKAQEDLAAHLVEDDDEDSPRNVV